MEPNVSLPPYSFWVDVLLCSGGWFGQGCRRSAGDMKLVGLRKHPLSYMGMIAWSRVSTIQPDMGRVHGRVIREVLKGSEC